MSVLENGYLGRGSCEFVYSNCCLWSSNNQDGKLTLNTKRHVHLVYVY